MTAAVFEAPHEQRTAAGPATAGFSCGAVLEALLARSHVPEELSGDVLRRLERDYRGQHRFRLAAEWDAVASQSGRPEDNAGVIPFSAALDDAVEQWVNTGAALPADPAAIERLRRFFDDNDIRGDPWEAVLAALRRQPDQARAFEVMTIGELAVLSRYLPPNDAPLAVVEFGSGFGQLGRVLLQLDRPVTYVNIDPVPRSLTLSWQYLAANHGDLPVTLGDTRAAIRDFFAKPALRRALFVPAWRSAALPAEYFDLAIWVTNPDAMTPTGEGEALRLIDFLCKENAFILRSQTRASAVANNLAYPDTWTLCHKNFAARSSSSDCSIEVLRATRDPSAKSAGQAVEPGTPEGTSAATPREPGLPRPGSLAEENLRLHSELQRLRQVNGELSRSVDGLRAEVRFRESNPINTYLGVARYCHERAAECKAEAYIAHGVEALPAADGVAAAVGGRVYCDVIEVPAFSRRSGLDNGHSGDSSLLDHAFDNYLSKAAALLTSGWALKERIRHYGPPVHVIPNYRYAEPLRPSAELREKCGVGTGDFLLLASGPICRGFEAIVEALTLLPDNIHLATLDLVSDPADVDALPARFGVARRVHFFNRVPYEQLTSFASGADLALMALDPATVNDRLSLPSGLFDCLAAGLPIVTPDVPDVAHLVEERGLGVTLPSNEARCWADGIKTVLAARETFRANVMAASQELVWDSLTDRIHAAVGYASSVTIIACRDLIGDQRTARLASTLIKLGVKVTICCPNSTATEAGMPGVKRVSLPSPLLSGPPEPAAKSEAAQQPEPDLVSAAPGATAKAGAPEMHPGAAKAVAEAPIPAQSQPRAEQVAMEQLKKEVRELRYKASRYDEIKADLPAWRAKAARYDRLKRGKVAAHIGWLKQESRAAAVDEDKRQGGTSETA